MLFAILCLSCVRQTDGENSPEKTNFKPKTEFFQKPYVTDLVSTMASLYGRTNEDKFEACDRADIPKIKEIVRALEEREDEIGAFVARERMAAKPNELRVVRYGEYSLVELGEDTEGQAAWEQQSCSWSELYQVFQEVQFQPMNKKWVRLDQMTRALMFDDELRILHGQRRPLFDPELLKPGRELVRRLNLCYSSAACLNFDFSPSDQEVLGALPSVREFAERYLAAGDTAKKFIMQNLLASLKSVVFPGDFSTSPIIVRRGKTLYVPLEATEFGADQDKVLKLIADYWNIGENKIEFVGLEDLAITPYFIKMSKDVGGRPSFGDRTIYFYEYWPTKTLAHEFGHVLGFSDEYFTSWDPKTCSYVQYTNRGDIMAGGYAGAVTPEHWQVILDNYPDLENQ